MKPLFYSHKVSISALDLNIYDYQLRDHLTTTSNVYIASCNCPHKHNTKSCIYRNSLYCIKPKCKKKSIPNKLFLEQKHLLYHKDLLNYKLATCLNCKHIHSPPCNVCLGCKIGEGCVVTQPFECNLHTSGVCCSNFTQEIQDSSKLGKHYYDIKGPPEEPFYICEDCKHYHGNDKEINRECWIQTTKCCENSIKLSKYNDSFYINYSVYKVDKTCLVKKLIFAPKLWKDTSLFVSFLTALVYNFDPNIISSRFEKFNKSSARIQNIKKYKSGKDSIMRNYITGFIAKALYQTATLSSLIKPQEVWIPRALYEIIKDDFYTDFCIVVRHPSFHPTALYVLRMRITDSPCFGIPDFIAIPLKQDQDGDKNVIFLIPKNANNDYDLTTSFFLKVSKLEMSIAFNKRLTLFAKPRYSFSQQNLLNIYRNESSPDFLNIDFFRKTYKYGPDFMINAGCSYLKKEYDLFVDFLIEYNKKLPLSILTLSDVFQKTNKLDDIVKSGVKPNTRTLTHLQNRLLSSTNLLEKKQTNINQVNEYLNSSKILKDTGHNQFICLYSMQDMTIHLGNVYLNKKFLADYKTNSCFFPHMFTEASLQLFIQELEETN